MRFLVEEIIPIGIFNRFRDRKLCCSAIVSQSAIEYVRWRSAQDCFGQERSLRCEGTEPSVLVIIPCYRNVLASHANRTGNNTVLVDCFWCTTWCVEQSLWVGCKEDGPSRTILMISIPMNNRIPSNSPQRGRIVYCAPGFCKSRFCTLAPYTTSALASENPLYDV